MERQAVDRTSWIPTSLWLTKTFFLNCYLLVSLVIHLSITQITVEGNKQQHSLQFRLNWSALRCLLPGDKENHRLALISSLDTSGAKTKVLRSDQVTLMCDGHSHRLAYRYSKYKNKTGWLTARAYLERYSSHAYATMACRFSFKHHI